MYILNVEGKNPVKLVDREIEVDLVFKITDSFESSDLTDTGDVALIGDISLSWSEGGYPVRWLYILPLGEGEFVVIDKREDTYIRKGVYPEETAFIVQHFSGDCWKIHTGLVIDANLLKAVVEAFLREPNLNVSSDWEEFDYDNIVNDYDEDFCQG